MPKLPMVNVRDYGAVGDGKHDDTPALCAALESGAGRVYFPSGIYRVTRQLAVPCNVHVYGDGVEATVVSADHADPTKFPDGGVFYFAGDGLERLPGGLAGDISRFDVVINLESTAGLQPNDVIVVFNPTPGSYSNFRPDFYKAGEFIQINEINSNQIRLVGGIQADYRKGTVEIFRLNNPTRSTIANMTVVGTNIPHEDAISCLRFRYGRGVSVRDVRLVGAHYSLLGFQQCFGALAENVEGEQIFPYASLSGLNYGIMIVNCQDVRAVNCRITAMRHAVAIGGSQAHPCPVNRHITISNCDLKATGNVQALDAHGNCESYTFENNRVHGGIDFGGQLGRIVGNDIYGRNDQKEAQPRDGLRATEWKSPEFEIRNNRIHTRAGGKAAIYLHVDKDTIGGGPTIITDNRVLIVGHSDNTCSLMLGYYGPNIGWLVIVDGNDFYAASACNHVVVKGESGKRFAGIIARNNTFRNGTVDWEKLKGHSDSLFCTGNWP